MHSTSDRRTGRLGRWPAPAAVLVSAAIGVAGCGGDPAVSQDTSADAGAERIERLALEARRLQEETAQVGRRLVEDPANRAEARSRLRELAGDARALGAQVRKEAPDAPEARAVRRAAERVERGAEQLTSFARSGRDNQLVVARETLNAADQQLDAVADRLDVRLGDEARQDLEALRRDVPELPAP